MDAELKPNKWR